MSQKTYKKKKKKKKRKKKKKLLQKLLHILQKTYKRSKLLIQVNNVARIESLWSWIISPCQMQNPYSKLILGIKS